MSNISLSSMKLDLPSLAGEDLPYIETLSLKRRPTKPVQSQVTTPVHTATRNPRGFSIPALSYNLPPPPPLPLHQENTRKTLFTTSESSEDEHERQNTDSFSFDSDSYDGIFYNSSGSDFETVFEDSGFDAPQLEEDAAPSHLFYRNNLGGCLLPPQTAEHKDKLCVVLDMDETLVHSEFLEGEDYMYRQEEDARETHAGENAPDFFLDVCDGVAVRVRPGLSNFLAELAKHFEVGIFTAAEEVYASPVLDTIDPTGHISFRLYRDATVEYNGVQFVKDLSRLGRDMRRTVLIDNNIQATLASPDNSLVCVDYYGDNSDQELPGLLRLCHDLSGLNDVRPTLRNRYASNKISAAY